jgi:hypothetical protein
VLIILSAMNARNVKRQKPSPSPPAEAKRVQITLGRAVTAFLTVGAFLLAAWGILYPRLTVEVPQPEIDRYNPGILSFLIRNTGYIPLYNVKPAIAPCEIDFGIPQRRVVCNGHLSVGFGRIQWWSKVLYPAESQTIELGDMFSYPGKLTDETKLYVADFLVRIEFQPWFVPYTMFREYRFYGEIEDANKMLMRTRPVYQ